MKEDIPALGRAALRAGHIIPLHSFSVKVQAGKGYFSLADMFVLSAVQASLREEWPYFILAPQLIAADFKSFMRSVLLPSGATNIPNIFEASCACSRLRDILSPEEEVAIRSSKGPVSLAIHLPLLQT